MMPRFPTETAVRRAPIERLVDDAQDVLRACRLRADTWPAKLGFAVAIALVGLAARYEASHA